MSEHPIEGMMNTTLEKIRQMVDVNTVVGDPITSPDGTIIIPISKISYGFASGGSDLPVKNPPPDGKGLFGGATGAGITVTPVAFLTISNGDVKMLQIDPLKNSDDRIISMVPDILDKVGSLINQHKEDKKAARETKAAAASGDVRLEDPQI